MSTMAVSPDGFRLYTKGASEVVLALCTSFIDDDGMVRTMSPAVREELVRPFSFSFFFF